MALSTYQGLKAAIPVWMAREGDTALITNTPDFVALAEEDIRNDARVMAMETLTTGTLTGETLDHPDRFISARRLFVGRKKYEYRTPEAYQDANVSGNSTGLNLFTSIGQKLYLLNVASGDSYSLIYTAGFSALANDADTNWILTNAPSVYLFAACRHAAIFMNASEEIARFEGLYAAALARMNSRENKAATSGSALQMIPTVAA